MTHHSLREIYAARKLVLAGAGAGSCSYQVWIESGQLPGLEGGARKFEMLKFER